MLLALSADERRLSHDLLAQPAQHENRFTSPADRELRQTLFRALAGYHDEYLEFFFPTGLPSDRSKPWSLREAQGAVDGAEYTAAAKGTACGHIFKNGESSYVCKTCGADDTCVLCAKCFESSNHEGHLVLISVSLGNSGCCDCGDPEAWKKEVHCEIHSADDEQEGKMAQQKSKQKGPATGQVPEELAASIRMTISRCIDYLCDVFSCAPEQMRVAKTEESVRKDEKDARLSGIVYGEEAVEEEPEFVLVLWNDEKHTMDEVRDQVARACATTRTFGAEKAREVHETGRSLVHFSRDVAELLEMARVLEQIKLTVTVRSARDIFREQMCSTIIDWLADISGCSVGNEPHLLRTVICEELMRSWRPGSRATNKYIGDAGVYDHAKEDLDWEREQSRRFWHPLLRATRNAVRVEVQIQDTTNDNDNDNDNNDDETAELDEDDDLGADMAMELDEDDDGRNEVMSNMGGAEMDIDVFDIIDDDDALTASLAAFAPPPPQTTGNAERQQRRILTPAESDDGDQPPLPPRRPSGAVPFGQIPATPGVRQLARVRPSKHWLEKPAGFREIKSDEPCEDIWQRVRLDFLVLYDLRLWKNLRIDLRHLYITTVVTVPRFKALLGLRFAGLYTALAQLYLIGDREPDHSIINLSLQILTTPTITEDVVERGNFMTNLMAILYTFLTTRQVGFPEDVNPKATLAFEAGTVANRRMFHFLSDLRYMFQSEFIHRRLREEQRYLLQFLDLIKLQQGVCPNVRATGEHVEYENETWISVGMIVQHINKLCKQVAGSFEPGRYGDETSADLQRAIRTVAQVTMINAFGYERKRFVNAEQKDDLAWHTIGPFGPDDDKVYSVPKHVVQSEPISFHHPLHYVLSWLIEDAKAISREELRALLRFESEDLKDPWNVTRIAAPPASLTSDELLSAIFDAPLRVCAWLAQIKAGMWVRNGIGVRHQALQYRSVTHRDVGYQRDILLLQAGLVLCGSETERVGERFLAQMIDRFQMVAWFSGDYRLVPGFEDAQQLDVIEDFLHLLIILLSERGNLICGVDERTQHDKVLQHDIAHALCFKPLSFSELGSRVTEKVGESDDFNRVLETMTNYRAPEGLSDTGTFELKPEFVELVNPYYAHYTRNQREEAEVIYKKHMAAKTGKTPEQVVYEPRVEPITKGLFKELPAFTRTPLFVRIISAALRFVVEAKEVAAKLATTRIETFLHITLHLVVRAMLEDEIAQSGGGEGERFVDLATRQGLVKLLVGLTSMEEFAACHPTILHVLRKLQARQSGSGEMASLGAILERADAPSPSTVTAEDKERKRLEAKARQAKIMAQMKQQQASFLQNQGLSGFDDEEDYEDEVKAVDEEVVEEKKVWSFPTGTCILCQEETDDERLYGTFEFIGESRILRTTPIQDEDFIREVVNTPTSLDRSAEHIRPFGVAGENRHTVVKAASDGTRVTSERQTLSKGFPHEHCIKGPVATSCGHIMHYKCFELYAAATLRRHQAHISRNHPERGGDTQEFVCPLCKALGNTFLPITWKAKECANDYELHATQNFTDWIVEYDTTADWSAILQMGEDGMNPVKERDTDRSMKYVSSMFSPSLVQSMHELSINPTTEAAAARIVSSVTGSRSAAWSRLFGLAPAATETAAAAAAATPDDSKLRDLWSAYERIDKTINHNISWPRVPGGNPVPALCRTLGLTISSFEIANRGVGPNVMTSCLIADMSEQALTHLRILSETIASYLAVHTLRPDGKFGIAEDTAAEREIMTAQLFGLDPSESRGASFGTTLFRSRNDLFLFFSDWLALKSPDVATATQILQLCYWAEIVKTIFVCKKVVKLLSSAKTGWYPTYDGRAQDRENFRLALLGMDFEDRRFEHIAWTDEQVQLLHVLVEKYALAFLRKSIILMHVRYGLDYQCPYTLDPEASELFRLTKLLHIHSIDELCGIYIQRSPAGEKLQRITSTWLAQAHRLVGHHDTLDRPSLTLAHPAIFELVGLPRTYDTLTEEAARRRCPTTNRELTDPTVCLMCGEIFCSQAVCCHRDGKGGVYQHMKKHDENVGLFINLRKCNMLFAHGPGVGGFHLAPYLDKHGEPDPTLRRHHQLFLHQKRYDKLFREAWLNHQIPTVIARKLEADSNTGGWETL